MASAAASTLTQEFVERMLACFELQISDYAWLTDATHDYRRSLERPPTHGIVAAGLVAPNDGRWQITTEGRSLLLVIEHWISIELSSRGLPPMDFVLDKANSFVSHDQREHGSYGKNTARKRR